MPAAATYCEPAKPFLPEDAAGRAALTAQQRDDELLDLEDVLGKRLDRDAALAGRVTIREENATPRWR